MPAPTHTLIKGLLGVAAFFGTVVLASALTISPARKELSADPGTTINDSFVLINEQANTQTFYTSAQNFEAQGESGTPSFVDADEGLASWVQVQPQVTLAPGQKVEIPFSITVPKGADVGGHFAAIFLSTMPPATKQGEVALGAKVGMLVLLRVNGDIKEGGGVLSFGIKDSKHFLVDQPIDFIYRFNNSGNDRANPVGDIVIRNIFGFRSAVLNANPTSGNVLPGSTRRFDVRWGKEDAIDPQATFVDHVAYEWRNFALGPYVASMSLSYGANGSSKSSVFFLVFPWHLLLMIALVLAVLFYAGRALIRKYNRWIIAQAKASR
jgi:hypothetical protein